LWFTWPLQRSLLVSWLFSAIPILLLNFQFFVTLVYFLFWNPFVNYVQSRDGSSRFTCLQLKFINCQIHMIPILHDSQLCNAQSFMKSIFYRENFKLNATCKTIFSWHHRHLKPCHLTCCHHYSLHVYWQPPIKIKIMLIVCDHWDKMWRWYTLPL